MLAKKICFYENCWFWFFPTPEIAKFLKKLFLRLWELIKVLDELKKIKPILKHDNFHKCDNNRFSQSKSQIYGEKIWDVKCKKGSMLHDGWIKTYYNLKSWIVTFCLLNTKKFCKALVGALILLLHPSLKNGLQMKKKIWGFPRGKTKKKNSPQGSTTFIKHIKSMIVGLCDHNRFPPH